MAVPKSTIWSIEPHTLAKHKILESYLKAWFPILSIANGRLNYIDGFAGPGIYSKGEPGSPIVAINVAKNHTSPINIDLNFIFIEENTSRIDNLKSEIIKINLPSNFHCQVIHGEFHKVIDVILGQIEIKSTKLAPTFVFIDPFGFSGIPFTVIEKLLKNTKVEVLITFMVDSINRFIEENTSNPTIISLFGSDEIVSIIRSAGLNRYQILRSFYQKQLLRNAKFVRYFSMKDSDDRPIYDLFFATNHPLGNVKMKEAMWNVDKEGFYRFSDSTDPNQTFLFKRDNNKELFTILNKERKANKCSVGAMKKFVEDKTPFLEKHLKECLRYAENNNLIKVEVLKSNGKKRLGKTFPEEVIVNFVEIK